MFPHLVHIHTQACPRKDRERKLGHYLVLDSNVLYISFIDLYISGRVLFSSQSYLDNAINFPLSRLKCKFLALIFPCRKFLERLTKGVASWWVLFSFSMGTVVYMKVHVADQNVSCYWYYNINSSFTLANVELSNMQICSFTFALNKIIFHVLF